MDVAWWALFMSLWSLISACHELFQMTMPFLRCETILWRGQLLGSKGLDRCRAECARLQSWWMVCFEDFDWPSGCHIKWSLQRNPDKRCGTGAAGGALLSGSWEESRTPPSPMTNSKSPPTSPKASRLPMRNGAGPAPPAPPANDTPKGLSWLSKLKHYKNSAKWIMFVCTMTIMKCWFCDSLQSLYRKVTELYIHGQGRDKYHWQQDRNILNMTRRDR